MSGFFKLTKCAALVGAVLATGSVVAAPAADEDGEELLNLLAILDEQTEIATKTKLNADFVPGMVTVLHGDDLEARGVATVWQALALVPGMELNMDRIGEPSVTVRGVGVSALSGKLKILLDDVAMNASFNAMGLPVLKMPVEQVERIEVIRGPGSAIHGEFAYAGVVNVISRKEGERAHLRIGEHGSRQLGAHADWSSPSGEVTLSTNVVLGGSDGEGVFVPSDALHGAMQSGVSNAPGTTNEAQDYGAALFNLTYRDFTLVAQHLQESHGPYFGALNVLPDVDAPDDAEDTAFTNLEARYRLNLSESMELALRAGWQRYEQGTDTNYLPDGYLFPHILFPGAIPYANGWSESSGYEERRAYVGVDLNWKASERHTVLAGLSAADIDVEENWTEGNVHPTLLMPLSAPLRIEGARSEREISSITLQDEFRLNDDVTLTFGLRYDDYDDVGDNVSPRLAAVWRIDHNNILKAQYAEAFRPPTLFELARTPTVEPETIESFEVGYVRRFPEGVGRVTLFHSDLKDLIYENNLIGFFNAPGINTRGVEFELERQLGENFKFNGNLSFADTEDETTGRESPWAAQTLASAGLIYQPSSDRTLSLQWNYVGDRGREVGDSRDDLDSYHTLDLTGTMGNLFDSGVTLRLGVNNLFDDDVRYPAGLTGDLLGNVFYSYEEDYPRPGRYFWAQLSTEF